MRNCHLDETGAHLFTKPVRDAYLCPTPQGMGRPALNLRLPNNNDSEVSLWEQRNSESG